LREPVSCGLPLRVDGTPSDKFPVGTSDVAILVSRLLRDGWRQSAGSCFAHPRLAICAPLLLVDGV
jgi:hypothetical protein